MISECMICHNEGDSSGHQPQFNYVLAIMLLRHSKLGREQSSTCFPPRRLVLRNHNRALAFFQSLFESASKGTEVPMLSETLHNRVYMDFGETAKETEHTTFFW